MAGTLNTSLDRKRIQQIGVDRFGKALEFTQTIFQRLSLDSNALDPILWTFKNWENLLWALQQQAFQVSRSIDDYR